MRVVVGTLGIAALLALAGLALQRGWADILLFQGRVPLRAWENQRAIPGDSDWALAHERLQRARDLDSRNPTTAEETGRLHELRARSKRASAQPSQAELRLALEQFRLSLWLRPGSPYSWANLAYVKSLLGQRDEEFVAALRAAVEFGPWEPEVQIQVAEIGFRDWERLPPGARAHVRSAVAKGLKRQDETLFSLALAHGRLDVICTISGVARAKRALLCI
jgi:hypothetical protein